MTILELREKRNKAWEAAKAFLESHRTEKGTLTAEDDATYTQMEQEINDLGKEIARLERQEALEAELNRPVNQPLTTKPVSYTHLDVYKRQPFGLPSRFYTSSCLEGYKSFGFDSRYLAEAIKNSRRMCHERNKRYSD